MGGTAHGRVDCFLNENIAASNPGKHACAYQAMFKTLYDFLSAHPAYTRIAWYKGDSGGNIPGGATRGSDYWDGAAPFGNRAFAVFKVSGTNHPWYLMIQWFDMQSVASNAAPATVAAQVFGGTSANNMVMCAAMAWAQDSGGNDYTTGAGPWNGTTHNDGTDAKGTPVWVAPVGGQVHVLPRSNEPGGAFATNKDAVSGMVNYLYGFTGNDVFHRVHYISDSDSLVILHDINDDGGASFGYCGVYVPRPNVVVTRPFIQVYQINDPPLSLVSSTNFGSYTYTGNYFQFDGGMAMPDNLMSSAAGCRSFAFDRYSNLLSNGFYTPNRTAVQSSLPTFDEFAVTVTAYEITPLPSLSNFVTAPFNTMNQYSGYLGSLDPAMVREVYGSQPLSITTSIPPRLHVGGTGPFSVKYSVPWSSSVPSPRAFPSRQGISF